ncbi:MAG: GNAT family N-acetyltransferase [Pseudomonadota bacterium]
MTLAEVSVSSGDEADAAQLEAQLRSSLRSTLPQSDNARVVLLARDATQQLVGGLDGSTSYGWLLVKVLWVHDAYRNRGLGRRLMAEAEARAIEHACHSAWLDTSSPDAMRFYQRLGFEAFGELSNTAGQVPPTHRRWFMKKALALPSR